MRRLIILLLVLFAAPVGDLHFHPALPRSIRVGLNFGF